MQSSSASHKADEKRPLVWPGLHVTFNSPFSSPFGRQHSAPVSMESKTFVQRPRFSFDWSGGRNGKSEHSLSGVLAGWGEVSFSSRQRLKPFLLLLLLSVFMFVLAVAFLPLVLLRPQKFCLFFTLGSLMNMASFAVLRGPLEQLRHMFSLQR